MKNLPVDGGEPLIFHLSGKRFVIKHLPSWEDGGFIPDDGQTFHLSLKNANHHSLYLENNCWKYMTLISYVYLVITKKKRIGKEDA